MRKVPFFLAFLVTIVSLLAILSAPNGALAAEHHLRHYGPFHTSNDPDSGTCGNNWANDTFNRNFSLDPNNPNFVVERFNGGFVTMAGQSPNACNTLPPPNGNGNTVGTGIPGNFHGFEDISVMNGTYNPKAKCTQSTCNTTAGFIATIFGASATYSVNAFKFNYYTKHNGAWQNADPQNGGNNGDITGLCC